MCAVRLVLTLSGPWDGFLNISLIGRREQRQRQRRMKGLTCGGGVQGWHESALSVHYRMLRLSFFCSRASLLLFVARIFYLIYAIHNTI